MELTSFLMGTHTLVSISIANQKDMDNINGLTEIVIQAHLRMVLNMAMGSG